MLEVAAARRILVVTKFRYLGDTIIATPFLRHLRRAAPRAHVALLAGPAIPTLLAHCPYVDEILTLSPNGWSGIGRSLAMARRLEETGFELAFLLNRSLHSALLARRARIPHRVGFDTERRGPLLTLRVPYNRQAPEIECFLDLLRATGVRCSYRLPELWVTDSERAAAERILRDRAAAPLRGPLVLIQPGARDAYRKQWNPSGFAHVAAGLRAALPDCNLVLVGSADEMPACEEVAAAEPLPNLAGATGLRDVLGLLQISTMLIANDTALVHAAAALNTITVSIQGPQTAAKWGYGPPHTVVSAPAGNPPYNREANRRALDSIQPDSVLQAALAALDRHTAAEQDLS